MLRNPRDPADMASEVLWMSAPVEWSPVQLAEFVTLVASAIDENAAILATVGRSAEALGAEISAVVEAGRISSASGDAPYRAPESDIVAAAEGRLDALEGSGGSSFRVLVVPLLEAPVSALVVARSGPDGFTTDEASLVEAMGRVLSMSLKHLRGRGRLEEESSARVRASEARTSAIVESALDAIVAIDETGRLIEFNPAAERTFGYTRDEAIGRQMADMIIPPALRRTHREGLARYLAGGEPSVLGKRLELIGMRADGSEFPVELAVTKVDLPGPPIFTGYIRDITERRRAERELERALHLEQEASESLRELDHMKDMFLQAVSHDLRTPLTVIMGLALTLENPAVELSPEDEQDLRSRLASNARKLDRILSNLLDLERLLHGVAEAERAPTWLPDLVRRVIAEADFLADRTVHVTVEPCEAELDGPKVERILENLLVNAVKHTPRDTPIWVRVTREGEAILVRVDDAGPGVSPELREDVFQPFRRGRAEGAAPGSGIGLSLVSRFAELHGGTAWVEEREGGGASFKVILPSARPRPMALHPAEAEVAGPG